ncbi:MAG TPA: hypothetical protein RMH85_09725 [Polyangiaceae bacterium LLY-WYZ-15_(1-7)]|nr:hypothetical protein [Myxococcales bacterium]MAT25587.1 hypothetical protein [Sandaracinus sp.]HJL01770.1 hypothetical protein [Polyangiaceae bacterium LLY-WYZ-15_(1-7)]HJL08767.1 hypothetical protein [Polyangiaceae bacterium LLY-WYZ-15_(1-7)]HJL50004.1 hypothetical protein [Polyangiaceae bacterium LLY-WYZ-15_(1-7)]
MRRLLPALALLLVAAPALADAPPPDGRRYVRYGFRVTNPEALEGHLLLAFPYDTSNGAPMPTYLVLEDGEAIHPIGRRGGTVTFYAFPEGERDALPDADGEQETLYAFFEGETRDPRLIPAETEATPIGTVDEASPVRRIVHELRVDGLEGGALAMSYANVTYEYEDGELETRPAGAPPTRTPSVWSSPVLYVSLAGLINIVIAVVVLRGRRRKKDEAGGGEGA